MLLEGAIVRYARCCESCGLCAAHHCDVTYTNIQLLMCQSILIIEIDKQIPESIAYSPYKLAEITDLPLGARGFHFIEEKGLLFVCVSEMKITSRIDSYITNVSVPSMIIHSR